MSKLSTAIDATLTGNLRASTTPTRFRYTDIKFEVHPTIHSYNIDREVRLGVRLQTTAWIHGHEWENTDARSAAIRDLKRAMIEEVFGEFRPLIIELRSAMYDKDDVRARQLIVELENQMFYEGF
jgi:hypothetical protein